MRKMFRMKYESCSGECYAYSDVMRIHNLGLDAHGAAEFLRRLVQVHEPTCGNANLGFRLDVDDDLGVFVASFERYGSLDLFAARTPLAAMNQLIDAALRYFQSDEYRRLVAERPGLGHGVCRHGDDTKLIDFAINFSGLDAAGRADLRQQFLS